MYFLLNCSNSVVFSVLFGASVTWFLCTAAEGDFMLPVCTPGLPWCLQRPLSAVLQLCVPRVGPCFSISRSEAPAAVKVEMK